MFWEEGTLPECLAKVVDVGQTFRQCCVDACVLEAVVWVGMPAAVRRPYV